MLSFRSGEFNAFSTHFIALFSPSASAEPIIATPLSFITVLTSLKSTLICPVTEITSAIPLAAIAKTSSAFSNAFTSVKLPNISLSLSLLITNKVSTDSLIFSMPSSACVLRFLPSKVNGTVIIPTVNIPMSLAACAITGAAPVPVPPPIPAVTKIILVFFARISLTSSRFSIAAFLPTSGIEPAPLPSVKLCPKGILVGTGLVSNA